MVTILNRSIYFETIQSKLTHLAWSLDLLGSLNILNNHVHSENFYMHFCNVIFDWKLQNLNTTDQNSAGVDLIDETNRIIVQVSATATRQKIEAALAKELSAYGGYTFKFISICKDADNLKNKIFSNPHNLKFLPADDILDIKTLLSIILPMEIDRQRNICEFLKKELQNEPDPQKMESNLTTIIKILSKEDWNQEALDFEIIPYDIEAKILHNHLDTTRDLIDDYKIHYSRINKIYSDFNKLGANKSLSILTGIRSEYLALVSAHSPDQCFLLIIDQIVQKIRISANYTPIPEEELTLCIQILVVDAFIRCKIFKNPLGSGNANS